jgi:hypothetical protein
VRCRWLDMGESLCGIRDTPAQCAQLTLAVRILPRGLRRGEDLLNRHRTHATNKVRAIDLVSVPGVVLEKGTPSLRRRLSQTRHVPRHRGFSELEAEHEQLTVNTRRSPCRVLAGHSTDERPDLRIDPWTSASVSALPGPIELEALAMPADYGLWFHNDQGVVPVWPQAAERDPECAVSLGQLGSAWGVWSSAAQWPAAAARRGSRARARVAAVGSIWRS